MPPKLNLIGNKFGRLLVVKESTNRHGNGSVGWICECDCGVVKEISSNKLTCKKPTRSCGCLLKETSMRLGKSQTTHGRSKKDRTYTSWRKMRERCLNENSHNYKWYGGRGIKICSGLDSFEKFLIITGDRPKNKSIDRIDNSGNYSCGKCEECINNYWQMNLKWSTQKEQMRNTTRTKLDPGKVRLIREMREQGYTFVQIGKELEIYPSTAHRIIKKEIWQ